MLTRRRAAHITGERGSVVMAMLVLMIFSTLTGIAVDRVIALSHRMTHQRDRIAAVEAADGALAAGYARIDRNESAAFSQSGALGAGNYQVVASPTDPDNWVLKGTGTSRTATASFTASLTRDRLYPFVLYTSTSLLISGPATGIAGPVGSSGSMRWTGLTARFEQHLVGAAATCSGCTQPVVDAAERTYAPAPRPSDSEAQPCPIGGVFTGAVDGRVGAPFRCESDDVSFVDTVTVVNGPLVVWVGAGPSVTLAGALINQGGIASDFILHKVDGGGEVLDIEDATIVGVIDAPGTSIVVTTLDLSGGLIAASLDDGGIGTDLIQLRVDTSIGNAPGFSWWRILDRRQTP
ncbi:MAG: hypothetical protein ABI658_12130 [Acidimicrobiales bacterium]